MRWVLTVATCLAALLVAGVSAQAGHRHKHVYVYKADRYAYQYAPRGYYPYYNSGHWRPTAELRRRKHARPLPMPPPYYQAWGAPHRHYRHKEWHYKHHGGHRLGHW